MRSVEDPRRQDAVTPMKMKRRSEEGKIEAMATYMSLLAMLCGIMGIVLKWKLMAFQSILCSLIAYVNTKTAEQDIKQILSSVSIALMGLMMCYRNEMSQMVAA